MSAMLDYKHPQQQRPYFISMPSIGHGMWEAFNFCGITDNCSKLLQHSVSWEQRLRVIKGQRGCWLPSDPLPLAPPSFGFGGRLGSREHVQVDCGVCLTCSVGTVVSNYPWRVFQLFPLLSQLDDPPSEPTVSSIKHAHMLATHPNSPITTAPQVLCSVLITWTQGDTNYHGVICPPPRLRS